MSPKFLKLITQLLLLSVIAVIPFLFAKSLYFPYVSGKAYVFRLLVALAFFFWVWLLWTRIYADKGRINADKKISINQLNQYKSASNILIVSLVLFFLAQALVSFFGVDPVLSFFSTIERGDGVLQYGFWALYFLMLTSVFRKERDWKWLFFVFIIAAILLSLYAWFNYSSQIRLHGIFGNSSYLAVFLLFAIGFSAIMIERKFFRENYLNGLIAVAAMLFAVTLIFTQTRGAYVGLAGGIFLFCLLSALFLREKNKKLALFCGIALAVGLLAVIALFSARETDFVQNRYILKRTASVAKLWEDDVVRERLLTWQIALKAFEERPVFGYGPENFGSAFNKHYDYRVGIGQPWFDRTHSQPLEILATGGIVLFSFYLFWLAAAIYLIFKISKSGSRISTEQSSNLSHREVEISLPGKDKKILSFILASLFLAYFLQGLFLFDVLPTYLGLFPFLAFLVFSSYNVSPSISTFSQGKISQNKISPPYLNRISTLYLFCAAISALFVIWATVLVPYKANVAALKFYAFMEGGYYKGSRPFLEKSLSVKSPYTFWEVRKRAGWQFVQTLEYGLNDKTSPDDIQTLKEIYDFITPELERFIERKPYDPQMYYVLGKTYRSGFEKLGKNDLDKAERVLKKGFNYSDRRAEYFNELSQIFILEGKFGEGENLVKEHIKRITFDVYFPYIALGNFYFVAGKYEQAMEQYEKAREIGYKFYENDIDYSRYMSAAEEMGKYQKIVDMAQDYLEKRGPGADTYFNIAVGYLNLEEKEKAKEFFLKAVELDKKYEEYRPFFAP